jgi:hypothetical protein
MTTLEMEIALIKYFKPRTNLVIPNVSWGMFHYECDLIVMTKAGCLYEIEIKVSKQDLKKDLKKRHRHENDMIKYLYFAIPEYLIDSTHYIPNQAGIIVVKRNYACQVVKKPESKSKYMVSIKQRYQLARLGALRILGLKVKIKNYQNKLKDTT